MIINGKEWSDEELLNWYKEDVSMLPRSIITLLQSDYSSFHISSHKDIDHGPEDITYLVIKGDLKARFYIDLLLEDMKNNPAKYE